MAGIRDEVASYNERIKLLSTSLNAVALGLVGFAVLRPLTISMEALTWISGLWALLGLVFHAISHYVLKHLIRERLTDMEDSP